MNIAVYITGHGFGHASRMTEVLKALADLQPDCHYTIRTSVPEWFFLQSFRQGISYDYSHLSVDVGVSQKDALRLQKSATLLEFQQFWENRGALIHAECEALKNRQIGLVLADIPPLAFEIADALGIKSVGITNFSWDWIYQGYTQKYPAFIPLIEGIRKAYGKATLLLRLPFHGDLSSFPVICDIPLVARHANHGVAYIKEKLGMPAHTTSVLLSFGGFGISNAIFNAIPRVKSFHFITTFPSHGDLPGVQHIREEDLADAGLGYPDVVSAADLVVGKPGYGLVSECIAHGRPLLYTSRGDFAEYGALVKGIKRYLPSAYIPRRELLRGHWMAYIQKALAADMPKNHIATDGAVQAAKNIIRILQEGA